MIVGLTGKNASGKGEVASYLREKGFIYLSLSDILREEARKRGIEDDRATLIQLGNEMRKRHGPGILGRLISHRLNDNSVVDSIRNPGEIIELRKNKDFFLLGIDAPVELRFKRALERGRAENATTLEEFREMEERENLKNKENQQLDNCLRMADKIILNDGSIEELHRKVEGALR